ncbi:MAG: 50S ribosomal protein L28 [Alphaproteobacteria bacterium]|nr:50S ribosomal protein L28 [Alphaproteobacteria bacterium]NDC56533.1 50S ribosomal protein L28 [Alphaproteobacteria bacterium]
MARQCAVTAKKPLVGNKVSHSNIKNKRRWLPNLQVCSFTSELLNQDISLRLSANGIRTVEKRGGIDGFLLSARNSDLTTEALAYKKRLQKAKAKKAA